MARLARSLSFRLSLIYAGLFLVSALSLVLVAEYATARFLTQQIDRSVADEIAEIEADAGGDDVRRMEAVIDGLVRHSPGFLYLLQNPEGQFVAGNMNPIRPEAGIRTLKRDHARRTPAGSVLVRGRGRPLRDGSYLFVGMNAAILQDVRQSLLRAVLWTGGAVILVAAAGGAWVRRLVLHRIEIVSRTSRAIMSGDLSRRIPLDRSGDEFDHLASSLNAMLERIETLMTGMRQVSSDIAHDLRTPLSRLRQRLEIARNKENSLDGVHAQLDGAIVQADTILATFSALLRIAQLEARLSREGFVRLDLGDVLRNLIEAYEPTAEEGGQLLDLLVAQDAELHGDRTLLEQLFANLLENALRHTPAGSRISVRVFLDEGLPTVTVSDDGPGIPPDRYAFVFGRFARLDQSRSTPGSGLGLSLVRAIATLHEATVDLSDNGPGLVCTVRFRNVGDGSF